VLEAQLGLWRSGFEKAWQKQKNDTVTKAQVGGMATQGGFWAARHELKTRKQGRAPHHPPTGPKPSFEWSPPKRNAVALPPTLLPP
jgi:hypothetical protein